jgi:ATP-dependent exoDNAse (exonuclease V) alpha subunit
MANFGLRVKDNLSRSKGQSAIARAAYNAREELTNERTGDIHDYRRNHTEPLLFSGIYTPANAPEWAHDRAQLWNHVERAEGRKDSQLARPIQIDLPHELTNEQRRFLVQDFVRENFTRKGYVVDIAIHGPHRDGDQRNYHAHLLIPLRVMDENGFAKTKKQEQEIYKTRSNYVENLREKWANITNRHLERYGHKARIDHRSLADQGIDREPTQHLGPYATQLERNGEESERGNVNRDIEARNDERKEAQRAYEAAQREREQWEAAAKEQKIGRAHV